MESRTLSIVEFISEASSHFCDTYYREGCGECPMNLTHGECLLTDIPQIIKEGINQYLKDRGESQDEISETD